MKANNMKAMREALVGIKNLADDYEYYGTTMAGALDRIYDLATAALAKPPRNCDVGTAKEQTRRMENEYCHFQKGCCERLSSERCPLYRTGVDCQLAWAQMPYVEGDAK